MRKYDDLNHSGSSNNFLVLVFFGFLKWLMMFNRYAANCSLSGQGSHNHFHSRKFPMALYCGSY